MRWMWIDQIVEYAPPPHGRLCAIKNVSLAEEHLHDHFPALAEEAAAPIMPASLIIEGMAQTAGILVGSVSGFREKVILAKVVVARLDAEVAPGQTIRYEATLEGMQPAGASTTGIVKRMAQVGFDAGSWKVIGRIDLMFSHLDQNLAGMEFPRENFVFSENFRTILRSAGLQSLVQPASGPGTSNPDAGSLSPSEALQP